MTVREILHIGHPVLREEAQPVDPAAVQDLIDDLVDTMRAANGAGLAANQIGEPVQVCVIEVKDNPRYPDAEAIPLTVLINPVVSPLTAEMEEGWEGCLSVPDMRGVVPRYTAVRLEAYDREGNRIDVVGKEFFARVLQHETDHLRGLVYLDRMKDLSTLTHLAEWNKYWMGLEEQDD